MQACDQEAQPPQTRPGTECFDAAPVAAAALRALRIDNHMADLGLSEVPAGKDPAVSHVASTHAGSESDVEQGSCPRPCSEARFGKCCQLAVVLDDHRHAEAALQLTLDIDVLPPVLVKAEVRAVGGAPDRAAESESDRAQSPAREFRLSEEPVRRRDDAAEALGSLVVLAPSDRFCPQEPSVGTGDSGHELRASGLEGENERILAHCRSRNHSSIAL